MQRRFLHLCSHKHTRRRDQIRVRLAYRVFDVEALEKHLRRSDRDGFHVCLFANLLDETGKPDVQAVQLPRSAVLQVDIAPGCGLEVGAGVEVVLAVGGGVKVGRHRRTALDAMGYGTDE